MQILLSFTLFAERRKVSWVTKFGSVENGLPVPVVFISNMVRYTGFESSHPLTIEMQGCVTLCTSQRVELGGDWTFRLTTEMLGESVPGALCGVHAAERGDRRCFLPAAFCSHRYGHVSRGRTRYRSPTVTAVRRPRRPMPQTKGKRVEAN